MCQGSGYIMAWRPSRVSPIPLMTVIFYSTTVWNHDGNNMMEDYGKRKSKAALVD